MMMIMIMMIDDDDNDHDDNDHDIYLQSNAPRLLHSPYPPR
jgi:hypothetical protein